MGRPRKGFTAFVAEADREGDLIWGLSAKDIPELNFMFSGGTQRLSNGITVICNWTGHHFKGDYIPVFDVNENKDIVLTFTYK